MSENHALVAGLHGKGRNHGRMNNVNGGIVLLSQTQIITVDSFARSPIVHHGYIGRFKNTSHKRTKRMPTGVSGDSAHVPGSISTMDNAAVSLFSICPPECSINGSVTVRKDSIIERWNLTNHANVFLLQGGSTHMQLGWFRSRVFVLLRYFVNNIRIT